MDTGGEGHPRTGRPSDLFPGPENPAAGAGTSSGLLALGRGPPSRQLHDARKAIGPGLQRGLPPWLRFQGPAERNGMRNVLTWRCPVWWLQTRNNVQWWALTPQPAPEAEQALPGLKSRPPPTPCPRSVPSSPPSPVSFFSTHTLGTLLVRRACATSPVCI